MKKHVLVLISLFFTLASLRAEPLNWSSQPMKLGRVDVMDLSWGIERNLGMTRAAPEFGMPLQLIYSSKEEGSGLFGPQWRSPQLESRLIPVDERVLDWKAPWGASVALIQGKGEREFSDRTGEWSAVQQGHLHFSILRKDGWRFAYEKGYLQEVVAPGGRKLLYRYQDKELTAISQVGPQGGAEWPLVQITLDSATGRAQSVKVGGVESRFTFAKASPDALLRLASWSRGGALAETFAYGTFGELRRLVTPLGRKETFEVEFEKPKKADVMPVSTASLETQTPKVSQSALRKDAAFQYAYCVGSDSKNPLYGKGVTVKDALGRTQNMNFSRPRGVLTIQNAAGQTTILKYYRQLGLVYDYKLRQVKNPQGQVLVENKYDRQGHLVWSRDLLGNVTQSTVDANGRVIQVDRILGGKGASEVVSRLQYDAQGRLVRVSNALNQTAELRYNAMGDPVEFTDVEGRKTEISYDVRGFVTAIKDPAGHVQKIEYDPQGRAIRTISADGIISENVLDDRGQVVEVKQLLPNTPKNQAVTVVKREFDTEGKLVAVTDALGRTTRNEFDAEGNLTATINPAGVATRYVRDGADRLVSFWMEKGAQAAPWQDSVNRNGVAQGRIDLERDTLDRLVKQTNAIGQETSWTYDKWGRLIEKNTGAQPVRYSYNKLGQTVAVDYGPASGGMLKYEYNALGRMKTVKTPTSSAEYAFDPLGRVTVIEMQRGERKARLEYGYTPSGQKSFVAWQDSLSSNTRKGRTDYLYSPQGQLAEIKSDGKTVAKYAYNERGLLSEKRMADGTRIAYSNDPMGRIQGMKILSAKGKVLTHVAYEWDQVGQLLSRTWDGIRQSYSYDPAGQLIAVNSSSVEPRSSSAFVLPSERYAYDLAGNMIEKSVGGIKTTMSYDTANRLLASATEKQAGAIEKVSYDYDSAGRLIAQSIGNESTRYQYGLFEKTAAVIKSDGSRVGFDYWPTGQIAAKGALPPLDAQSTTHNGDPFGIKAALAEKRATENNALTVTSAGKKFKETEAMLWDGLALLQRGEESFTIEPHVSGGVPLTVSCPASTTLISDFLGTTLGTVQGETFTPAPLSTFGESVTRESRLSSQFFTGKPYDADLKGYNFLCRNYQPSMARWTATDPSGFPDGANNTAYAPVPTSEVDPLGLELLGNTTYAWSISYLSVGFSVDAHGCYSAYAIGGSSAGLAYIDLLPSLGAHVDQTTIDQVRSHEQGHVDIFNAWMSKFSDPYNSWLGSFTTGEYHSQNDAQAALLSAVNYAQLLLSSSFNLDLYNAEYNDGHLDPAFAYSDANPFYRALPTTWPASGLAAIANASSLSFPNPLPGDLSCPE